MSPSCMAPVEGGSAERVLRGLPTVLRAMPIFALSAPRGPRLSFSLHPERESLGFL